MLDAPELPLHNNEAESDIRELGTRRKLGVSFWQYLLSRLRADGTIPLLPDVIRARATATVLVLAST